MFCTCTTKTFTIQYILHYITLQYSTVQYSTVQYSTVQHSRYSIAHLITKSFSHARDHPMNSIHVQYCQHLSQVLLTFFCACDNQWNTVRRIAWVMSWNNPWTEFHLIGILSRGSHELFHRTWWNTVRRILWVISQNMIEYCPEDFTEHDGILSGGSHELCYRTW